MTKAAFVLTLALASAAHAQVPPRTVIAADSAFAVGNVALAESLYYVGARQRPRDPLVREGLGRFLAAQGRPKVAVVLLEEARMFGGDPSQIARHLAPLYEYLGEWRALLTLSGSPLTSAERRRASWMADHPFAATLESGAASTVGTPRGDTIARVAVRVGGRAAVAAIVGSDVGFIVGARLAGNSARHFEGDSTILVLDSVTVGQVKLVNVPATMGTAGSTMVIGAAALARLIVQVDYARNRIALTRTDVGSAEARHMLVRYEGQLRVLDNGRWIPLGEFATSMARSSKTIVIDVGAGEVRVRR